RRAGEPREDRAGGREVATTGAGSAASRVRRRRSGIRSDFHYKGSMAAETFPIDLGALKPVKLDPTKTELTDDQRAALKHNIQLCRDAIVFFTALAGAKGLSGHTGGAYDTVPEMTIIRGFIAGGAPIVPIFFDEAGHRVATQYLLSVLEGHMPAQTLLHYPQHGNVLPGHPETLLTPGAAF